MAVVVQGFYTSGMHRFAVKWGTFSFLESIDIPLRSLELPLRMSITDISKGSRANVVNVVGRLESGFLQVGDTIISEPGGNKGTVRSMSQFLTA